MTNEPRDSKRSLRIGLLVDSLTQPRWVSKIINDIQSSDFAEICLVVKNEATSEPLGRLQSYWKNRKYLLYALYNRIVEGATDPLVVPIQPRASSAA